MITIGKTKSVCPVCMKVLPAKKCIGEEGIYLTKECDLHGKFRTLIWEGSVAAVSYTHLDVYKRQSLFLIRMKHWHRFSVIIFFLRDVRLAAVRAIVELVT